MSPDEYIAKSEKRLEQVEEPVYFLCTFYSTLHEIRGGFQGLYPAMVKLTKQFGVGLIFDAIVKNYYGGKIFSKNTFYQDILYTAIGIKKLKEQAASVPTAIHYSEYLRLRDSANA